MVAHKRRWSANLPVRAPVWEAVHRGRDDPLFPATRIAIGASHHFESVGLDRKRWANTTPIRTIFREAFKSAGFPYFNPHSFRRTLALFVQQVCQTPEEFKAWSQNIALEDVMTTFRNYGRSTSAARPRLSARLASNRQRAGDDGDDKGRNFCAVPPRRYPS